MKKINFMLVLVALALFGSTAETTGTNFLITPEKAKALIASDPAVVLLDVRTAEEFASGHIAKSVLLPYDAITAASAAKVIPVKTTTVVVYCRSGRRSAIAAETLRGLGYKTVYDLGGIVSWPYDVVK